MEDSISLGMFKLIDILEKINNNLEDISDNLSNISEYFDQEKISAPDSAATPSQGNETI